jgi:hypothetical protein
MSTYLSNITLISAIHAYAHVTSIDCTILCRVQILVSRPCVSLVYASFNSSMLCVIGLEWWDFGQENCLTNSSSQDLMYLISVSAQFCFYGIIEFD